MKPIYAAVLVLMLAPALDGCGFRLRGASAGAVELPNTYISNAGVGRGVMDALHNALRGSGVTLADSAAAAELLLTVSGEARDRRVLSVGSTTGKVNEYELNYRLFFEVKDRTGAVLVPRERVSVVRDYRFDETAVLAKSTEEATLYREMEARAVSQIVRRLRALGRKPGAAQ